MCCVIWLEHFYELSLVIRITALFFPHKKTMAKILIRNCNKKEDNKTKSKKIIGAYQIFVECFGDKDCGTS